MILKEKNKSERNITDYLKQINQTNKMVPSLIF